MVAREGYVIIGIVLVLAAALSGVVLLVSAWWGILCLVVAASVTAGVLFFFRDPARMPPPLSDQFVLAPADGRVVIVDNVVSEPLYLGGVAQKVSIFLSLFDVHVNRIPVDGMVEHVRYIPGKYLIAWRAKASEKNERSEIGIRHPSGARVLFRQIAGSVARRIVYHVASEDQVEAGQRFGIIKFGSRMDVFMPQDVTLRVSVGDRVRAGETILGQFPTPGHEP